MADRRLIEHIRNSVIGDDAVLDGPFGPRRLVYADYTASGRALTFVEDYIRDRVLPLYANTHTEASATGLHTTALREDARRVIHRAVGGGADDVVLFCGSGSTAAIDTLIRVLELDRYRRRPVVFIGPYEHHSNELPWRESVADVVTIREDADGRLDIDHLDHELRRHADRPLKIGSFSAASNVTGIITDVDRVARVLRRHGALSCWDYATAGPYLPIDMAGKDAVFLSPHKFVGGPGTPGCAGRQARAPAKPRAVGTGWRDDPLRQPAQPPLPPGSGDPRGGRNAGDRRSIRAGLVFALKEQVGAEEIRRREHDFARRALASWGAEPEDRDPRQHVHRAAADRLVRAAPSSAPVALELRRRAAQRPVRDPGTQRLLLRRPIHPPHLRDRRRLVGAHGRRVLAIGNLGARLGFVRVGFNYFISEAVFQYILAAVHLLAEHAWKLLPLYRFDPASGAMAAPRRAPGADAGRRAGPACHARAGAGPRWRNSRTRARSSARSRPRPPRAEPDPALSAEFERIRWFPLPREALALLSADAAA